MARAAKTPEPLEADRAPGTAHPRVVYGLLGHQTAEATFRKAMQSGRLHHAWLISGAQGIGKATLAYRFIRRLLGGQALIGAFDIAESDPVAGRIAAQGHGNLRIVRRPFDPKYKKLKSEIPVSEVRALSKFFRETAAESDIPRIGLIDKADELNASSENAVLKLLEEPPDNGMLFLLADVPGRLLPTIRSRCARIDLRPIPHSEIRPWLSRMSPSDDETNHAAAWFSRGAPGRALALLEHNDAVLRPLLDYANSLKTGKSARDMMMATSLSGAKARADRELFWGALQDLLAAYARYESAEVWDAPFDPPSKSADWRSLYDQAVQRELEEGRINMEPRASLLDFLGDVRAA